MVLPLLTVRVSSVRRTTTTPSAVGLWFACTTSSVTKTCLIKKTPMKAGLWLKIIVCTRLLCALACLVGEWVAAPIRTRACHQLNQYDSFCKPSRTPGKDPAHTNRFHLGCATTLPSSRSNPCIGAATRFPLGRASAAVVSHCNC